MLPTNLDNDPGIFSDFRGTWNHNFLNSYFDPRLKSRASIDINLTRLATEMPYPEKVAGTGAIRATLSWGDQPDVDLHIFEPNGSHVYYLNPVGQDGELDVDDTDGQGPENYFVACDAVNVGTYQFGVNYFHGFVPEHAVVSILVGSGSSVLSREVTLQESRGREGNSTPISIFEVTVADDGRGNAIYNVK